MSTKYANIKSPHLYHDLADWFHLLTAPEDYKEEAAFYSRLLTENSRIPVNHVLEMGSGGGNNASHMKSRFKLTLTDLSEDMLAISRRLNPECEHIQGDMRNLRLGRRFDAVFIHDAISYITTEKDLRATLETAFFHCKPDGSVLFCPDHIKDTFRETSETGGHDDGERGLRYLDWTWDPDPSDTTYTSYMVYIMKEGQNVNYAFDEHILGLFSGDVWLRSMESAGFTAVKAVKYTNDIDKPDGTPVFVGFRPD